MKKTLIAKVCLGIMAATALPNVALADTAELEARVKQMEQQLRVCLLYTSPSPRDRG